MPSERKREYDISIYSHNDDLSDVLKALKEESGLTYRKLLRQMIEEVSASERLRKKVLDYYNTYAATWTDGGERTVVRITLDEPTFALATALAFQLCGNGKLSELGRLLIRFYEAEGDSVGKYVKSTDRISLEVVQASLPKRSNVVSIRSHGKKGVGEPETPSKKPTSVTLDEETVSLLGMLVQKMHMKNNELVSHLVEKYAANEHKLKELHKSPAWEAQISAVNTVIKRFNFSEQIVHLLTSVSFRAIGTKNKSALIRAFIRIEADLRELRVTAPNRRARRDAAPRAGSGWDRTAG
jgi:hypothetical protein